MCGSDWREETVGSSCHEEEEEVVEEKEGARGDGEVRWCQR